MHKQQVGGVGEGGWRLPRGSNKRPLEGKDSKENEAPMIRANI